MDVKCENCQTVYSLNETLVSASGTSVRCTKCGVVFKVFRPSVSRDEGDNWIVKHVDGTVVSFDRLAVLQQWISEGKISRDDLISRKDGAPKRIGDMPEMQSFFAKVQPKPVASPKSADDPFGKTMPKGVEEEQEDSNRRLSDIPLAKTVEASAIPTTKEETASSEKATHTPKFPNAPYAEVSGPNNAPPIKPKRTTMPPKPISPPGAKVASEEPEKESQTEREEPDLSQVPAAEERDQWDQGDSIEVAGPAWAERSGGLPRYDDELDQLPPPKRKMGRWIALILIIAIVGGGAYIFLFNPSTLDRLMGNILQSTQDDRYIKFFDRGRENFLLDSETRYRQADREFQKVLALEENHGPTLAALTEMYAVWAQYLKDAKLDLEASKEPPKGEADLKQKELDRLSQQYEEKLAEASRWMKQAILAAPDSKDVNRAAADVERLKGNLKKAKSYLAKAREQGGDPATEYVAALIEMDEGKPPEEIEKKLAAITADKNKPLLRATYRQARVQAYLGKTSEAKATLEKLFEMNSNHLRGRDLAARIDEGKPIALTSDEKPRSDVAASPSASDAGAEEKPEEPVVKAQKPTVKEPQKSPVPKAPKPAPAPVVDSTDSMLLQAVKAKKSGQTNEAISLFKKVLERSPNNIDALSGLGQCYLDMGNSGQAIATFRRAVNMNPSFGPALIGLANTYKKSGQKDQALKYYKKYLESNPNGRQSSLAKRNIAQLEGASPKPEGEAPKPETETQPEKPAAETDEAPAVIITPPDGE